MHASTPKQPAWEDRIAVVALCLHRRCCVNSEAAAGAAAHQGEVQSMQHGIFCYGSQLQQSRSQRRWFSRLCKAIHFLTKHVQSCAKGGRGAGRTEGPGEAKQKSKPLWHCCR